MMEDGSKGNTDQFANRSEIEREARRLEKAVQRQLAEKARLDETGRFHDQNRWVLGDDTWMPKHRRDYIRSGYLVVPLRLEDRFFAGEIDGWHLEFYPSDRPTRILRLVVVGDAILGRSFQADVDLEPWIAAERGVSRQHALLRPASHCIYIIDVGSTNGTFVNGLPLSRSSAYALHHNSVLTLGRLVFTLKILRVGTGDLDDERLPVSIPGSSPFVFTPSHPTVSTDDDPTLHMPARQACPLPPDHK